MLEVLLAAEAGNWDHIHRICVQLMYNAGSWASPHHILPYVSYFDQYTGNNMGGLEA